MDISKFDKNKLEIEYRILNENSELFNARQIQYMINNMNQNLIKENSKDVFYKIMVIGKFKYIMILNQQFVLKMFYKLRKNGSSSRIKKNVILSIKEEEIDKTDTMEGRNGTFKVMLKKRIAIPSKDERWSYDFTLETDIITFNNINYISFHKFLDRFMGKIKSFPFRRGYVELEYQKSLKNTSVWDTSSNNFILSLEEHFLKLVKEEELIFKAKNQIQKSLDLDRFDKLLQIAVAKFRYLSQDNIDKLKEENVYFTLKLDGLHNHLFISQNRYYLISNDKVMVFEEPNKMELNNSLFEVEVIDNEIYFISVIYTQTKNYLKRTYLENFDYLNNFIYDNLNNLKLKNNSGTYTLKRLKGGETTSRIETLLNKNIPNDGLLIIPLGKTLSSGSVYKWKLPNKLTVDFTVYITESKGKYILHLLSIGKRENTYNNVFDYIRKDILLDLILYDPNYCAYEINVSNVSEINNYENVDFKRPIKLYTVKIGSKTFKLFNGLIVECVFKKNNFVINNLRRDKTLINYNFIKKINNYSGINSEKVIDKIMKVIKEPVSKQELIKHFS
jgi:hypothetical protein